MSYKLRKIQDEDVKNKVVFLRADLDVPLKNFKIEDDSRLFAVIPTIDLLLKKGARVIIAGHLGRPKDPNDFQYSLEPVLEWLARKLDKKPIEMELEGFSGWKITENLFLLENLRLYKEEEEDNLEFSKKLASLANIYVNDAFAVSHRAHSSIVGIAKLLPSYAGLHLQKEIEELSKVLNNPTHPLTVIIGGAKIETKLPMVEKMHKVADNVLVGGEIAEHVKELAKVAHERVDGKKSMLFVADLTQDREDISEVSIQNFVQVIQNSKTIVWNGPMGEFEKGFDKGSKEIAKAITQSGAYIIVGGGETIEFCKRENLLSKISFVSTGGGAMLEFLAGQKLPGLDVLSL